MSRVIVVLIVVVVLVIVGLIAAETSARLTRARPGFEVLCCYLTRPKSETSELDTIRPTLLE